MKIILESARELETGVWSASAAPHQLAMLGPPKASSGSRSVVLAAAPEFDGKTGQLTIDADSIVVLNIGTTGRAVLLDSASVQLSSQDEPQQLGPGDREFMHLAQQELHGEAQEAAIDLIRGVRASWPGDLKRGERNNLSNTPDNFWYVIVQPRVQALSITIRGAPDQFQSSTFELRVDRPGYTRFTLKNPDDIPEALRLIEQSKLRKRVTFEDHAAYTDSQRREILHELRSRVLALDPRLKEGEICTPAHRIAYKVPGAKNFLDMNVLRSALAVHLVDGGLPDLDGITTAIPETHGWGELSKRITIETMDDLNAAMPFIEASYRARNG